MIRHPWLLEHWRRMWRMVYTYHPKRNGDFGDGLLLLYTDNTVRNACVNMLMYRIQSAPAKVQDYKIWHYVSIRCPGTVAESTVDAPQSQQTRSGGRWCGGSPLHHLMVKDPQIDSLSLPPVSHIILTPIYDPTKKTRENSRALTTSYYLNTQPLVDSLCYS